MLDMTNVSSILNIEKERPLLSKAPYVLPPPTTLFSEGLGPV